VGGRHESEAEEALNLAISKLQDCYAQGLEIHKLLELGPGGKSKDGEISRAAKKVGDKWGCKIGDEQARKVVEFSQKFNSTQMLNLVKLCVRHKYSPNFGLIKRLFPLGIRDRNKLLKKAILGKWKQTDLDAEIEKQKTKDQGKDSNNRGRYPKAAKSLQSLTGEAILDARKWTRVVDVLGRVNSEHAFELTSNQKRELRTLARLLRKISKWTD